jgi:hypothetical protein
MRVRIKGTKLESKQLREMELTDVISWMGRNDPSSPNHDRGMAELRFREITLQMKSSQAQIEAAEAEKLAATAAVQGTAAAQRNARYMFASVVVAALAALVSAV